MPTIQIKGMSCQHCVESVSKALAAIDGISKVEVDLASNEAHYEEEKPIPLAVIKNGIFPPPNPALSSRLPKGLNHLCRHPCYNLT